ncbi:MAG TPA: hypothetical protein DDY17_09260 [Syntrophaceae bacterium]|nr:hypothetical protein [Syntrophaceae bacterium]
MDKGLVRVIRGRPAVIAMIRQGERGQLSRGNNIDLLKAEGARIDCLQSSDIVLEEVMRATR